MKRLTVLFMALFIIAGIFAGCGSKNENAADNSKSQGIAAVYPLKVKDANGFEMTLEKKPVRIVSLTLGTDEILLGLISTDRLTALTKYSDDPGISNVTEAAKKVPNKLLSDAEKVIALQPDLVIIDTWAPPDFVKQLRDAKITVYVFKTPSDFNAQKNTVLEIAHIVGADKEGRKMAAWMDDKLKAVENRLKTLKPEQKLTVMDYGEMGSSGKGTNFDDIVTRAGLTNVVSKAGMEGWPQLSKENIIEMNPDIIILPSWYYDSKNSLQGMTDTLKNDKSLAGVKAIMNNRLITVPNPHISAISQYMVLGIEDVARAAYPELFK